MKKYNIALAKKFIRFITRKWSLIIKDYTKPVKNPFNLDEYDNYFYSINSYISNPKTKEEIYLNRFNWYLFDIDIKENMWDETDPDIIKCEIREKVLNYFDYDNKILQIHLINETQNWFHLIHFFDKPIEIKDIKNQRLSYNEDYVINKDFLEKELKVVIDKWAIKTTQIGSIPWTRRFKEKEWGEKNWFMIKIIRGIDILELDKSRIQIEKLDILEIIKLLWIKINIEKKRIIEKWIETDGYKINLKENYINNFTKTDGYKSKRPTWWPFNFILNYYKLENDNIKWAYGKTRNFFKEHFWIITQLDLKTKIKMNKFLHINLSLDNSISQEHKKYVFLLNHYLTKYGLQDIKKTNRIDINEFKMFTEDDKIKTTTIKKNLVELNKKILKINTEEKSFIKETKLVDIEFKKEKWVKFRFIFLPEKYKYQKSIIYNTHVYHFINNNILKLTISNNLIIDFYLHILQNLIFENKAELYLKNDFLDNFWFNKNITLRKNLLEKISKITNDFYVKKEQKWFIFF